MQLSKILQGVQDASSSHKLVSPFYILIFLLFKFINFWILHDISIKKNRVKNEMNEKLLPYERME